ncbi:MAG: Thioredoxin, partial [uncultured Solirubrobacteraceae bacterium]
GRHHRRDRQQLPGRGHRVRHPRARRLLGAVVRPLPRGRSRARGDRLRARRHADRQAQRRREPADRRPVRGPVDPDDDPLPQRPDRHQGRRRAAAQAPRGPAGARPDPV